MIVVVEHLVREAHAGIQRRPHRHVHGPKGRSSGSLADQLSSARRRGDQLPRIIDLERLASIALLVSTASTVPIHFAGEYRAVMSPRRRRWSRLGRLRHKGLSSLPPMQTVAEPSQSKNRLGDIRVSANALTGFWNVYQEFGRFRNISEGSHRGFGARSE